MKHDSLEARAENLSALELEHRLAACEKQNAELRAQSAKPELSEKEKLTVDVFGKAWPHWSDMGQLLAIIERLTGENK